MYFYHLAAYSFEKGNYMDKYDVEYRMRAIKDTCDIFDELLSYDTGDDYWKRCVSHECAYGTAVRKLIGKFNEFCKENNLTLDSLTYVKRADSNE